MTALQPRRRAGLRLSRGSMPSYAPEIRPERGAPAWFAERSVGGLRPGDHAWLAYSDVEERDQIIGDFVRDGLATEEKVVYISDLPPYRLPGLRRPHTHDPRPWLESGQLRVISKEESCLNHGRFDPSMMMRTLEHEIAVAFDQGFRAVRITADFTWAVCEPGGSVLLAGFEDDFGALVSAGTMAIAVCQVDRRACDPRDLLRLRDGHEVVVLPNPEFDDGILKITRTFQPTGLRLEGELDPSRHPALQKALAVATVGSREIHLDLGGLRFVGLDGLNLLVRHAIRLPRGGRLVLDDLAPETADLIDLVGWQRLPCLIRGRGARR